MKHLRTFLLMLIIASAAGFGACKKNNGDAAKPDHKVVFKATTNPHTYISTATYTDDDGNTRNFNNTSRLSAWSSPEVSVPASAKKIALSAMASGLMGDPRFYLTVEIWVDGVKKAETKTTTVNNTGNLIAAVSYTF